MKKMLVFLLSICISMVSSMPVLAVETSEANGIYVLSQSCPELAIAYAKENFYSFVEDLPSQDLRYAAIDIEKLELGKPFAMIKESTTDTDVYYFPVFYNNSIYFTLRVYLDSDGAYIGILSEYLAMELQNLSDQTSKDNPLMLSLNNGNVMQTISGKKTVLIANHSGSRVLESPIALSLTENLDIVNIGEKLSYHKSASARAASSKYLYLDLIEQQGSQSWCSAFAGSSIIRYLTNYDIKARDIMSYFYPNSSNLESESISHSQLISYANIKGLTPSSLSRTVSQNTVVSQITASKPIYLSCVGDGVYKKENHALVLRGYNTSTGKYSVWNPWYNYYETMPISTGIYKVDSSSSFTWTTTIYRW